MKNYFIIHGSFANPDMDWYPWLKEELTKLNKKVFVPTFPVGVDIQNYDAWKEELDKYKEYINEDTVFIAHSIGPIFVVKYLIENKIKIDSLYSISGFNGFINIKDFDKVNESFFMKDYSNFDIYCKERIAFYSKSDQFVPLNLLETFAKTVKADIHVIDGAGHFIIDDGYETFPELISIIKEKDNKY